MLPLHTLLKHLNDKQLIRLERKLQKSVNFKSKTLLIFNCAMLGLTAEETIKKCNMSMKTYKKYERPIFNAMYELFKLKATSASDKLLTDIHYSLYNDDFNSDRERADRYELYFHLLKKYELEQESQEVLFELNQAYKDTPLEAVYSHLYKKYSKYSKVNEQAYKIFINFCDKLQGYLAANVSEKAGLVKPLILDFKLLRNFLESYENNTLKAIFLLTKITLVQVVGQKQLLLEEKLSLNDLFEKVRALLKKLPFSLERAFLQNIYTELLLSAKPEAAKTSAIFQQNSDLSFGFPKLKKKPKSISKTSKTKKVLSNSEFIQYRKISTNLSNRISTINLPQRGSMSYSAT